MLKRNTLIRAKFRPIPRKYRALFPVDMLRYDRCWPADERDSVEIMTNVALESDGFVEVEKLKVNEFPWSDSRWASFGWERVKE